MSPRGLRVENRTARFAHVLASLLFVGWASAALLVALGGAPNPLSAAFTWLLLIGFGTGAVGFVVYASRLAVTTLEVGVDGSFVLLERTLFRRRHRAFRSGEARGVEVVRSEDQDGADYFRAVVTLSTGETIVVAEGHRPHEIEQVGRRLRAALLRP